MRNSRSQGCAAEHLLGLNTKRYWHCPHNAPASREAQSWAKAPQASKNRTSSRSPPSVPAPPLLDALAEDALVAPEELAAGPASGVRARGGQLVQPVGTATHKAMAPETTQREPTWSRVQSTTRPRFARAAVFMVSSAGQNAE